MLDYHEWLITRLSNYEEARDLFIEAMNDLEETGEVDAFNLRTCLKSTVCRVRTAIKRMNNERDRDPTGM